MRRRKAKGIPQKSRIKPEIAINDLTGQYDKDHRKVKALGTYLNWTKVPLGGEEVHILNVYLEPGLESFVGKEPRR